MKIRLILFTGLLITSHSYLSFPALGENIQLHSTGNSYFTSGLDKTRNYILKISPLQSYSDVFSSTTAGLTTISYYDGLGRCYQVIQKGFTPEGADLVTHTQYDKQSRPSKQWLPVPVGNNNGAEVSMESITASSLPAYRQDPYAYKELIYEASPLNRIEKEYGPGQEWRQNGEHCLRTAYKVNTSSGEHAVRYFYEENGNLKEDGHYRAGTLNITEQTDEDGKIVYTYTDKRGQAVLSRQMNGTLPHDTYFIYNDWGGKSIVLSPKAVDELGNAGIWTPDHSTIKKLAYLYRYDKRRRCIAKKYPGADWIYQVYDRADHLVFSQDGNQRTQNLWTFYIYDQQDRLVISGNCKNNTRPAVSQQLFTASWNGSVTGSFCKTGYTIPQDITLEDPHPEIVYYYDHYNFKKLSASLTSSLYNYGMPAGIPDNRYGTDNCTCEHKGLLTGKKVYNLGATSGYLEVYYYDDKGLLIQSISDNSLSGGIDKESIQYNFSGQPVKRIHEQLVSAGLPPTQINTKFKETYTYQYDHAGRNTQIKHQINDQEEQTICSLIYNELGQIWKKSQGNTTPTTFTYNIRGWISSIIVMNKFMENLYYTSNPYDRDIYYNGNIAASNLVGFGKKGNGQTFRSTKSMTYKYDGLNRLTNAEMRNYHDGFDLYFENFTYDKNGNILSLSRGWKDSMEDDLSFTYSGNQMTRVADAGNDMYLSSVPQIPCNIYDNAFSYDENGNQTKDIPRKIGSIAYNSLNLASQITKNNGDYMKIKYGADGKKHSSEIHWAVAENVQPGEGNTIISPISRKYTYYAANAVYEGEASSLTSLSKIYIDGGFLTYDTQTSRYKYYYYYNDHLGSNCMVVDESGKILQEADYLPSGLPTSEYGPLTTDNKLHLNMEFESLLGIHLYDNEARWRDPIYNRFISIDPLCEKYPRISSYAVCDNNPMNKIDLDGKREWPVNETYNSKSRSHFNNFNAPRYNGRRHGGLDINLGSRSDDLGAPVFATHEGIVTKSVTMENGDMDAGGNRVLITSVTGKVATFYMHLNEISENIKVGDFVPEGMQIGTIGGTGKGSYKQYVPHLHYEIIIDGEKINPVLSKNNLIDPQKEFIKPILLPEVKVAAPTISLPIPQLPIPSITIPAVINN